MADDSKNPELKNPDVNAATMRARFVLEMTAGSLSSFSFHRVPQCYMAPVRHASIVRTLLPLPDCRPAAVPSVVLCARPLASRFALPALSRVASWHPPELRSYNGPPPSN